MYLGIDIGKTKIDTAVSGKNLKVKKRFKTFTPKKPEELVKLIQEIVKNYRGEYRIKATGIGIPFPMKNGLIVKKKPPWNNYPIIKELKKAAKIKAFFNNDTKCTALAELVVGKGRKYRNFIYLTLSTGIGAGIIIDKKLYQGLNGLAGEVGYMYLDGKKTWDNLAGGKAIAQKGRRVKGIVRAAKGECITAALVAKLARRGNKQAVKIFKDTAKYNALGILNIIACYDPEAIIIGGGLANNYDLVVKPLKTAFRKNGIKIKILKATPNNALLGALILATGRKY